MSKTKDTHGTKAPIVNVDLGLPPQTTAEQVSALQKQYGCGPVQFAGTDNGLYERHLLFDNVINVEAADNREKFEAFARSVRDVLSQRWVRTRSTYDREKAKRVY